MTFASHYRRVCRIAPELDYQQRVKQAARFTFNALTRKFQ